MSKPNIKNQEEQVNIYTNLMDMYINTIIELLDTSYTLGILPFKIIMGMYWIKKQISENRIEILQNGIKFLLTNKETILNFDLTKLDELDEDSDDNMSIKSCVNNFKTNTKYNNNFMKSNINDDSDEMLKLIIEIKNNTKKLSNYDVDIIKKYFELLIIILEKIQELFIPNIN